MAASAAGGRGLAEGFEKPHNIEIPKGHTLPVGDSGEGSKRIVRQVATRMRNDQYVNWTENALLLLVFLMTAPLRIQVAVMRCIMETRWGQQLLLEMLESVPVADHEDEGSPIRFQYARTVFKRNQRAGMQFLATWWRSSLWERRWLMWSNPVVFAEDCRRLLCGFCKFNVLPVVVMTEVTNMLDADDISKLLDNCQRRSLGSRAHDALVKRQFNMMFADRITMEAYLTRSVYWYDSESVPDPSDIETMLRYIIDVNPFYVLDVLRESVRTFMEDGINHVPLYWAVLTIIINKMKPTRSQLKALLDSIEMRALFSELLFWNESRYEVASEEKLSCFNRAYQQYLSIYDDDELYLEATDHDRNGYSESRLAHTNFVTHMLNRQYDTISEKLRTCREKLGKRKADLARLRKQAASETSYVQELTILMTYIKHGKSENVVRASANNFFVKSHLGIRFDCSCWKCKVYWSVNSYFRVEGIYATESISKPKLMRLLDKIYKMVTEFDEYGKWQWVPADMCYKINQDLGLVCDEWGWVEKPKDACGGAGGAGGAGKSASIFAASKAKKKKQMTLEVARNLEENRAKKRQAEAAARQKELERNKKIAARKSAAATEALYGGGGGKVRRKGKSGSKSGRKKGRR